MSYEALFQASLYIQNKQWTKDTLAEIPTCKGVLLFADSSGSAIQLLQAANLRRTAQAKLHREEDEPAKRKPDVSDLTTTIYYTCCYNNLLMQLTYIRLAHAIFEKKAPEWIQLPQVSMAAIDPHSFLPYFYVTAASGGDSLIQRFGLFPTRKTVAEFCEIMNTAFVLCRNPSLLNSGRETSCSYLQMQNCPGPCINESLRENYAGAVNKAIQTAGESFDTAISEFHHQMQQASEHMDFERAQGFKKKIDALNKLSRPDFQYVHALEDLCFLHIDTGEKVKIEGQKRKQQQLMWFKVTSEGFFHLGDFVPESENSIAEFIETHWTQDEHRLALNDSKELLSLVSLQLFRSQRNGIWIDCSTGIWLDKITAPLTSNWRLSLK